MVGVDISEDMIAHCRAAHSSPGLSFQRVDVVGKDCEVKVARIQPGNWKPAPLPPPQKELIFIPRPLQHGGRYRENGEVSEKAKREII